MLDHVHWETNAGSIIRALWLLSTSSQPLSDTERAKILRHAGSTDPVVRGSISRLAFLKDDEALAATIISSRTTYADGARDFERDWGASALSKFSNSLSFEDAATRLHICAASYLVVNRGNRPDEVNVYAEVIDVAWQKVTGAEDGILGSLPVLRMPCEDSPEPRLLEFADKEPGTVTLRDASLGWGGGRPFSPEGLKSALNGPAEIDYKRRADLLKEAWSTDAHHWYGHEFCWETIRQIRGVRPDLLEKWRVAALGGGIVADKVRTYGASLYGAVCPVLLRESPREGRELWEALRRFGTGHGSLPLDEYLFYVDDNAELDEMRWQLLQDCATDEGVAQIARYASKHGRQEWIRRATERAVSETALEVRARGLTLASFADVSVAEFDELVRKANLAESWLESVALKELRPRAVRNAHAKWWFRKFIDADTVEESWGALQLALHGSDERFKEWPAEFENDPRAEVQRRLRFLRIAETRFEKQLNRVRERMHLLFGIKIEAGQHARFLGI